MNIQCLKLKNGEAIIAEVLEDTEEEIKFQNPTTLYVTQQGSVLIPWILAAKEDEISIDRREVLCIIGVRPEVADEYEQQYSNITVVKKPDLVLP